MGNGGGKDDRLSHRPFAGLKLAKSAAPKPAPAKAKPVPQPVARADEPDEVTLFAQAMHDVQPLKDEHGRVLAVPAGKLPDPDAEDREVTEELTALVRGEIRFQLSDTDEFIEGAIADLDKRTRTRLRRGELAVQAHLDLHGLTREEAHRALEHFIWNQRGHGHRCVLVIHGRGKNSPAQLPVLKEQMARWLSRGQIGKSVLGFCTARPCDGGAGAVYVLLRR